MVLVALRMAHFDHFPEYLLHDDCYSSWPLFTNLRGDNSEIIFIFRKLFVAVTVSLEIEVEIGVIDINSVSHHDIILLFPSHGDNPPPRRPAAGGGVELNQFS